MSSLLNREGIRLLILQFSAWLGGIFFYRLFTEYVSSNFAVNLIFTIGLFLWCIILVVYISRTNK